METRSYDELDPEDRALMDAAREATGTSYAPYSGVRVGAALRTADGVITGSNLENAAYGSTICAERAAIARANTRGIRGYSAVAIIATGDRLPADQPVAPCGTCRQVLHEMAEVSGSAPRVLMGTPGTDAVTVARLDELLPLPFDPLST